jgi:hypothetical protein
MGHVAGTTLPQFHSYSRVIVQDHSWKEGQAKIIPGRKSVGEESAVLDSYGGERPQKSRGTSSLIDAGKEP